MDSASLIKIRRLTYSFAGLLLAAAVPSLFVLRTEDWFRETVVQAWIYAGVAIGLLIAALEMSARVIESPRAPTYLLVLMIPPMLIPAGYVCLAAWFGRANASPDSWHLLSLFVIINFVFSLFVGAALVVLAKVVFALRD